MSDHIESVLDEHRLFEPDPDFVAQAGINSPEKLAGLWSAAEENYERFWADQAEKLLDWETPFTTILDDSEAPNYGWFTDGRLNVSYNCLDRHLDTRGDRDAIIFEREDGSVRTITYRQLHRQVCRFANALKAQGAQKGDRIIVYMPMGPEAVVAMQACARIGALHSVVFGGFSAVSLRDRIQDAGAKIVITADGAYRAGRIVELKRTTDEAVGDGCDTIERVLVMKNTGHDVPWNGVRDLWFSDALADVSDDCPPTWVEAEHPLFILYTSGSTGKPKGIQHSSAGYLLGSMVTLDWVFDLNDDDIFWCTADVGWITGHTYIAYGPLAMGATQVVYEGAPTFPNPDRLWEIVARHRATIFYTAPTAIRALMKLGEDYPAQHDMSCLRLLGTVGEPINPEAWMWYRKHIGRDKCPIVDTWWQTETGSIMISPVPGVVATKPGSCTKPLPGIYADIVDEDGVPVPTPNMGGYLVIRKPWPAMLRSLWGDPERFYTTYWEKFDGRYYLAGDSARRDEDGYFWIMGRIDDVVNISGHRLGTMEVESSLVAHPSVVEAAVVSRPHDVKGESLFAFVIPRGERPDGEDADQLIAELRAWVTKEIGPIAKPDDIRFTNALPKTRSGKIMRRLLRAIARGEEITQDTSTLEDENVILQLQGKA